MKRVKVKKILMIFVIITVLMMVPGCGSALLGIHSNIITQPDSQFFLGYNEKDVIHDQSKLATITSIHGLEIDGVQVNPYNFRVSNAKTGFLQNELKMVVDILPGEHKVTILYSTDLNGKLKRVILEPVTFYFEAGHFYIITINALGTMVTVMENNSAGLDKNISEKRINAVFEKMEIKM